MHQKGFDPDPSHPRKLDRNKISQKGLDSDPFSRKVWLPNPNIQSCFDPDQNYSTLRQLVPWGKKSKKMVKFLVFDWSLDKVGQRPTLSVDRSIFWWSMPSSACYKVQHLVTWRHIFSGNSYQWTDRWNKIVRIQNTDERRLDVKK